MTKDKLAAIKNRLKEDSPAVIGALAVACATLAAALIHEKMKLSLDVSHDDLKVLKDEDCNLTYSIDGSDYTLHYRGNTPKN